MGKRHCSIVTERKCLNLICMFELPLGGNAMETCRIFRRGTAVPTNLTSTTSLVTM